MDNINDEVWVSVAKYISVLCVIIEIKDGRGSKYKAKYPDERLGKFAFFEEKGEYIFFDLDILNNYN